MDGRTKEIIDLRFNKKLKLREIGSILGISHERVRQIIVKQTGFGTGVIPRPFIPCLNCGKKNKKRFCNYRCARELAYKNNLKSRNKCSRCGSDEDLHANSKWTDEFGFKYVRSFCRKCGLERGRKYRQTEKGKEVMKKHQIKNYQKNKDKAFARSYLHEAVKNGMVVKPKACEKCNLPEKLDGHHPDYSQPLKVIWLCRLCHKRTHMALKTA